ncbi:MAG: hypothetical protein E2P02_14635 [Acidobacteria bacterium]|nr:MAG: hypothetical protein E2P02_14635 [Acidobacteriota bacterium]
MKRFAILLFAVGLSGAVACVSRRVDVVPFLAPTENATLDQLVAHINEWRKIDSLVLRVDLQFETVEKAEEGEGRQYRMAQGRLLLQRPNRIRLTIEAPILSTNIAEMASDGERFQLLIYPLAYRALIEGQNDASYGEEVKRLDQDPELKKAGPLVNIRPQHFTDAFLLSPIPVDDPYTVVFLQEERVIEADRRPGAKKNSQVKKSYYVVTAVRLGENAPRARYWFDRTSELLVKRQQVYDADGRLVANIEYADYLPPRGEDGPRFASRVRIERPYDNYTLVVNVRPDGITVNRDLPDTAFVVTAPAAWGDSLRRIDLETRNEAPR